VGKEVKEAQLLRGVDKGKYSLFFSGGEGRKGFSPTLKGGGWEKM